MRRQRYLEEVQPYSFSVGQYDRLLARKMQSIFARNYLVFARRFKIVPRVAADVGCGTGRFVRFLRARGVRVYGVDPSKAMLRAARAINLDRKAIFLRQDVRTLCLPEPVDLVTCNFDVLNYLLRLADLRLALTRIHNQLAPGGYCLFDMITPMPAQASRQTSAFDGHGGKIHWRIETDRDGRQRRARLEHHCVGSDGLCRTLVERHEQRAYSVSEIDAALSSAGLVPVSTRRAQAEPRLFFIVCKGS